MIQNMAIISLWLAALARINAGIVSALWCVDPLFMAIADYFVYK
jgi:hypothetical protein